MGNWVYKDTFIGPKHNVYQNIKNYDEFINFLIKNIDSSLNIKHKSSPTLLDVGGYDGFFCNEVSKKIFFLKLLYLSQEKKMLKKLSFYKIF